MTKETAVQTETEEKKQGKKKEKHSPSRKGRGRNRSTTRKLLVANLLTWGVCVVLSLLLLWWMGLLGSMVTFLRHVSFP